MSYNYCGYNLCLEAQVYIKQLISPFYNFGFKFERTIYNYYDIWMSWINVKRLRTTLEYIFLTFTHNHNRFIRKAISLAYFDYFNRSPTVHVLLRKCLPNVFAYFLLTELIRIFVYKCIVNSLRYLGNRKKTRNTQQMR